ncbi:hypothetical protein B0H10DRAFT_1970550 [Mycena sp. CBHHK59/15]|nr:hypothetical protein B0H10DRAFT_1970550 [Mycena sp. CBHHK59/15]
MSLGSIRFDLSFHLTGSDIGGSHLTETCCAPHGLKTCQPQYRYPEAGDASDESLLEAERTHLRRHPRSQLGDLLARGAENSLTMGSEIGYPGDDLFSAEVGIRFVVYRISDTYHLIMDRHCSEDTMIESTLLADSTFDLQSWYAGQRAKAVGLKGPQLSPSEKLGDSLILGAQVALEEGILTYPGDSSEFLVDRFSVFKYEETCHYWIWDKQHRWSVDINREYLLDETFDLIGWYRNGCKRCLTLGLDSWMWCDRPDCRCSADRPNDAVPFIPMYREWGIDWDDADNDFFDYIELLNERDLVSEKDEWLPCVKQSLTRIGDLLGKAIVEALDRHDGEWPGDEGRWKGPGPRFLLHTQQDEYYGILDSHRGFQVKFLAYELLCQDRTGGMLCIARSNLGCGVHYKGPGTRRLEISFYYRLRSI